MSESVSGSVSAQFGLIRVSLVLIALVGLSRTAEQ